ncbi:hypothetical protein [Wenxinia marina]|uniref:Wenxma_20, whole genome shotgun sequence n=1 Tax=Wenxinia marina DSM 24838 TaxID=1123501 RepID=A0A0D0PZ39_9RHOB|nr:hypothetical protein [Wenxinia marina]KIQ67644.1 hypothetical protein Wenmar_03773 [Wenxinia marina DSM 24838]GGL80035.1 hypothetical protein GCM10011392_38240 [Wenxinia marina]
MNPLWLLRMARWARHPPPLSRILLVLAVVGVCVLLWAVEQVWGWPDWLTPERAGGRIVR